MVVESVHKLSEVGQGDYNRTDNTVAGVRGTSS